MASTSSSDQNKARTRLQEKTEKRKAEEQLQYDEELKRQKQLFSLRKTISPRDIFINSSHPNSKSEENGGCNPCVKQETLEIELSLADVPNHAFCISNLPSIKLEVDNNCVVKVEETLDLEEFEIIEETSDNFANCRHKISNVNPSQIDQNRYTSGIVSNLQYETFYQNHLKLLKILVHQKYEEIKVLLKLVKGLQLQLNASGNNSSSSKSEHHRINTDDSLTDDTGAAINSSFDVENVVKKLTLELTHKNAIIRELSMKMLKLQNEIFGKLDDEPKSITNGQTLERLVQEPFEMVLPFLHPELKLNEFLRNRLVCRSWKAAIDIFLSTNQFVLLHKEIEVVAESTVKHKRIPECTESPTSKLAKAHRFPDSQELEAISVQTEVSNQSETCIALPESLLPFESQLIPRNIGTTKINCIQCGRLCKSENALRSHTNYHHTERTIPCPYCKNKYHTEAQLSRHIEIHTAPEDWKYQCKICQKTFRRPKNLIKHMTDHEQLQSSPQENNFAAESPETSKQQNTLPQPPSPSASIENGIGDFNNDLNHIKFDECAKIFQTMNGLDMHKRTTSSHNERQFVCQNCGRKYCSSKTLSLHIEKCQSPEKWKLTCNECNRKFRVKRDLNQHLSMKHNKTEELEHVSRVS